MKKTTCLLFLVLYLATGCKQIVIWKYGIRNPKTETPETILAFAKKLGQDPGNIYLFRDSAGFRKFMKDSLYKKACLSAIVFNNKGQLVNYRDSSGCQWSAVHDIEKLKKDTIYKTHESHRLSALDSCLVHLEDRSSPATSAGIYDYTVIFTWAKYIGKLNERLFCINEAAKNNRQASIRVISLNVDMQKSWNLRKDQKMKLN